MQLEALEHDESVFVTLTYDEANLPPGGILSKLEMQLFMKKLRMALHRKLGLLIRYFIAGEYGSKHGRPHYHLILFGFPYMEEELLRATWTKGFIDFRPYEEKHAAYVAKYVAKGWTQDDNKTVGPTAKDIQPEFCLMSRRPGIGLSDKALAPLVRMLQKGAKLIKLRDDLTHISPTEVWKRTYRIRGVSYMLDTYLAEKVEHSARVEDSPHQKHVIAHTRSIVNLYQHHKFDRENHLDKLVKTEQTLDKIRRQYKQNAQKAKR